MPEDERIDEKTPPAGENEAVEAHGAKQVAGIGLAAAALIGAGAVGVKVATDDDKSRKQAALLAPEARERLAKADADGDGYVSYHDLAKVEMKFNVAPLNAEGSDVTAEALAAAGAKIETDDVGREDGYQLEADTIVLKFKVDEEVDKLVQGPALEWAQKLKELDPDGDGYAGGAELIEAGWRLVTTDFDQAGSKQVDLKALQEAGIRIDLATLGEGGYTVEDGTIFHKGGIDEAVDTFLKQSSP